VKEQGYCKHANLAIIYGIVDAMGSTCDVNWSHCEIYPFAYVISPM